MSGNENMKENEVRNNDANRMICVVRIGALPPSIQMADVMLQRSIDRIPAMRAEIERTGTDKDHILEDFFGVTSEYYDENMAIAGLFGAPRCLKDRLHGKCGTSVFYPNISGISIYVESPEWGTDGYTLYLDNQDFRELCKDFPERNVSDLYPIIFSSIEEGILDTHYYWLNSNRTKKDWYPEPQDWADLWIADEGYPLWFDLISQNPSDIFSIARKISRIMYSPFKDFMAICGVSVDWLCAKFWLDSERAERMFSDENPFNLRMRFMFAELTGAISRRSLDQSEIERSVVPYICF